MNPKHYEGRPCQDCGGVLRYKTNGRCVACTIKRSAQRHHRLQGDPEYRKKKCESSKQWAKKHPRDPAKVSEYNRHYFQTVTKPKRQQRHALQDQD